MPSIPRQFAAIVVLIALHREAALLVSVRPGQSDVVLLGLGEEHQCADAKRDDGQTDRCANAAMNILTIRNLRDGRCRDARNLFLAVHDPHLVLIDDELNLGSSRDVLQRATVVHHIVGIGIRGEDSRRHKQTEEESNKTLHLELLGLRPFIHPRSGLSNA